MTQSVDPAEFQDRVVGGTDEHQKITLTAKDGSELEDVEQHAVSKHELSKAISAMPDEVFEGIEAEEEDISAEEAEDIAESQGGAPLSDDMYDAFERLCTESLEHPGLSKTQMELIIEEFNFNMVFELGSQILDYSIENSGNVEDFRVQS